MLVLTRRCQESIVVGGLDGLNRVLRVTVLAVKAGRVKLGIDATGDVPVHRAEVWERLRAQSDASSGRANFVAPVPR